MPVNLIDLRQMRGIVFRNQKNMLLQEDFLLNFIFFLNGIFIVKHK